MSERNRVTKVHSEKPVAVDQLLPTACEGEVFMAYRGPTGLARHRSAVLPIAVMMF